MHLKVKAHQKYWPCNHKTNNNAYDRIAARYDRLHERWLHHAGASAQSAMEGAVYAMANQNTHLLDAGCGTGKFAERLISAGLRSEQITQVDASSAMLSQSHDFKTQRIVAPIEHLPFLDAQFDIVTCAWVLETLSDPVTALQELCRVTRPHGALCIAFCAQKPNQRPTDWLFKQAMKIRGTGKFLPVQIIQEAINLSPQLQTQWLPCRGPAMAAIIRRHN